MDDSICHETGNATPNGERSPLMNDKYRVLIEVWDFVNREMCITADFNVDTESGFDALKAVVGQITGEEELNNVKGCLGYRGSSGNVPSQDKAPQETQPSAYSA